MPRRHAVTFLALLLVCLGWTGFAWTLDGQFYVLSRFGDGEIHPWLVLVGLGVGVGLLLKQSEIGLVIFFLAALVFLVRTIELWMEGEALVWNAILSALLVAVAAYGYYLRVHFVD